MQTTLINNNQYSFDENNLTSYAVLNVVRDKFEGFVDCRQNAILHYPTSSFLLNCFKHACSNNKVSNFKPFEYGELQGSVLRSLFFIIPINDLQGYLYSAVSRYLP